jgi:hypothetical protein
MAPLWCALALVAGVSDDEAAGLAAHLTTAAPPGLTALVHRPGTGWALTFATPLSDDVLTCTRGPKDTPFSCSRGSKHTVKPRPDVAAFIDTLAVPASRWLAVTLLRGTRGDEAELTLRDGDTFEQRLLVRAPSGDVRVTQALPLLALDGSSFPPRLVSRPTPDLAVLAYEDGGNGNNASGFVRYRLVRLVEEGGLLALTATLELGGGSWGRAVTEEGIFASSSVDLLCPHLERTGVRLARVCSGSVDPRGAPTFERLCAAPRCTRPPDRQTPSGDGRWIVRGHGLQRLRAQAIGAAGASSPLVITEAIVERGRLSGLELHNPGATAVELSMLTVGTAAEASFEVAEPCVIDSGEHLWLAEDETGSTCTLTRAELPVAQPVQGDAVTELVVRSASRVDAEGVLRPGRPLARRRVNLAAVDEDEPEIEARSWQVDPRGRACLAAPSPGRPNAPCPAKARQGRREK